ncbi:MAG: hypothetical protein R3B99_07220, partial [Polyangiales bacterium]
MASPLRFGSFLTDHFAADIVSMRREREKAASEIVDDADPSTFGPSSAPPPAVGGSGVARAPKAPKLPSDLLPPPNDELPYASTEELDAVPPPPPPPPKVPALSKSGAAKVAELSKSGSRALPSGELKLKGPDVVKPAAKEPEVPPAPPAPPPGPSEVEAFEADVDVEVPEPPRSPLPPTPLPAPLGTAPLPPTEGPGSASVRAPASRSVAPRSMARARPALSPFTPLWYAAVFAGATAFGTMVFFVVRAIAG